MGAFSFLSRNSSRKVSAMIAGPLDRLGQDFLDWRHIDCMHSLERHGTRALVTVGKGHVTRGTQSNAYQKLLEIEKEIVREVARGEKPYLRKSTDGKAQINPLN